MFDFLKYPASFEVTWKDIVQLDRPQMTIWRMRIVWWITKATNTHSEYVVLIAFPLQQWLHDRASLLRYTCTACHVFTHKPSAKQKMRLIEGFL